MIVFTTIKEESLDIVLEILNSNPHYKILVNRNSSRSIEEARIEFCNQTTESYLIMLDNKYIGIIRIGILKENTEAKRYWTSQAFTFYKNT